MSFNATRLTCFALISAIETDCRDLILSLESNHEITWPQGALAAAERRYTQDRKRLGTPAHVQLVEFLDFGDAYQILLANKTALDVETLQSLTPLSGLLEKLIAVRNRVAHSRPMEIDDLAIAHDVSRGLEAASVSTWVTVHATLRRLELDPAFVLGLTVQLPSDPLNQSLHNLPIPDFDETGFFGRSMELRRIKKALLGPWPVVSILGDGGIGKTAIALKAAYDILDDPKAEFEAVVWVTAKATTLTSGEIQNIAGAIQDSLGMFEAAAAQLSGLVGTTADAAAEVLEYLGTFRILLILDNLETVTDQGLRDFLLDMPNGSKVLITSRIGLGMENPVKLDPLSSAESKSLLKALASIRNVQLLKSLDDQALEKLVTKLKGHPLYIKWLVAGVQSGRRPSDLVNDNGLLLDFCMSNVYDKLSPAARRVLQSMQVIRGPRGQGELAFLNNLNAQQVQETLLELMTTNFVAMKRSGADEIDGSYETGDFASQYLARHQPVDPKIRSGVTDRSIELAALGHRLKSEGRSDPYSVSSIDIRGQHDVPAGRLLFDAQRELRNGNFDEAINLCHEAQTLSPTYYEAWRVEAVIHDRRQDRYSAMAAFERAHEIADGSPLIGYHYGTWLSEYAADHEKALTILQAAAREDQESPQLIHQIARTHFYLEDYEKSIDSCRAMAVLSQNPQHAQANIDLALRAGVFGVEQRYWRQDFLGALGIIEIAIEFLGSLRAEQIDAVSADWLMRLAFLATAIAKDTVDEEYLSSRARGYAGVFSERVRVADPASLERQTAQVVRVDKVKHFGFVRLGARDYFFHHNDLMARAEWSSLEENTLVAFVPDSTNPKGPRAMQVRVLA